MPLWLVIFFILAVLVAAFYAQQAFGNLSQYGNEHASRLRFLTTFADRKYFTDEGWRYRNRSWFALAAWVVAVLMWILVS